MFRVPFSSKFSCRSGIPAKLTLPLTPDSQYTSLPTNVAPANPLCQYTIPPNVGASLCPVPGLLAIGADASGKHVYAVGAGSTPLLNPGDINNAGTTTVATFGNPLPVILVRTYT